MRFSYERLIEIWDDENQHHIEVGFDRDGLGFAEVRFYDANNKCHERTPGLCREQVQMLSRALGEMAEAMRAQGLERKDETLGDVPGCR